MLELLSHCRDPQALPQGVGNMDQIHRLNVVHRYEKRSLLIAYAGNLGRGGALLTDYQNQLYRRPFNLVLWL